MKKPVPYTLIILTLVLTSCFPPPEDPLPPPTEQSQSQQDPADTPSVGPTSPQRTVTEPADTSQQDDLPTTAPPGTPDGAVPDPPAQPTEQDEVPATPTPDLEQDPVSEELDEPARQYEAQSGESLKSDASIGSAVAPATMHEYLKVVLEDVDSYWVAVWAQAGYQEPMVSYNFPMTGEVYPSLCGDSDDNEMSYCPIDDTIVFSQDVATRLWNGQLKVNPDPETGAASGDFSVAFLVAHEYAHNLQAELALIPRTAAEVQNRRFPVYKTELHADCWSGVWANSAYYKGYLQGGDVEEAIQTGRLVGDYGFSDPDHHGTPQQRIDAFMMGYNTGTPSTCDTWLLSDY